jgi:DNA repair protein RecO (recombination protein O)
VKLYTGIAGSKMSLKKSEAVILKSFNWSESSRTVVFFALNFGRLALIDKGGRSIKSKRGRLQQFSRMEITFYHSEKETSGYISEIEIIESFSFEKDRALGGLAYASAACEQHLSVLPDEEPQRQLYNYFTSYLKLVDFSDKQYLPSLFLAFYLRSLSIMGYHPSITYCVGCGKEITEKIKQGDQLFFSGSAGGVMCGTCQKTGDYYISLTVESYDLLLTLQTTSLSEAAKIAVSLKQVTPLMDALTGFLSYQTSINSELKSLEFIEKLKTSLK